MGHDEASTLKRARGVRGGVAWLPISTGVLVAFGALLLLSALVGAVLVMTDVLPAEGQDAATLGVAGAASLLVAQFGAYLWGGYTAGRMARGSGPWNGISVAALALLVGLLVAGLAAVLDAQVNLNVPFTAEQLPIDDAVLVEWGVGYGVATLLVMFGAAALGGALGARWHDRLEEEHRVDPSQPRADRAASEGSAREDRAIDMRDGDVSREKKGVTIGNRTYRT